MLIANLLTRLLRIVPSTQKHNRVRTPTDQIQNSQSRLHCFFSQLVASHWLLLLWQARRGRGALWPFFSLCARTTSLCAWASEKGYTLAAAAAVAQVQLIKSHQRAKHTHARRSAKEKKH